MKKNLHFVLALTLGLATTVSAQDWSVDSRTRVNSTEDATSTEQRVRAAVEFGGEAVSVYAEVNSFTTLGALANQGITNSLRQAYATTNLMDFASLKAGRMALTFGSGRIMGDNDWVQENGNTWDGFLFGINNDFADVHVGYSTADNTEATDMIPFAHDASRMFANISKDMGNMGFNLFYTSTQSEDMLNMDDVSMGLDATYAMDNGAELSLGYYTNDNNGTEMDLTSLGVSYAVNDDLTVHAGYDMYGENGFYMASGSFGDFYGSGMEYSTMTYEGTDMTFGGSYAMGDFMIGATMHTIKSENETIDYSVMDLSLGYSLSDNSGVSVNYATTDRTGEDVTKTWISLNVGF
ncbi:MAG: hypothetical protein ISR00_05770 [Flavobacteriales bacterium]|nr:hypothetical protein [Flavobacteriales bacterium]MBL6873438.1 hypothetical protein [Flavobacteriales bacterium]